MVLECGVAHDLSIGESVLGSALFSLTPVVLTTT